MTVEVPNTMKSIAVLVFCAVVACGQAHIQKEWCSGEVLRGAVLRCAEAYKATQGDVDDYVYLRYAASENAKCFRGCIFSECKTFNPDGTFRSDLPKLSAYLVSRIDEWKYDIAGQTATYCRDTIPVGHNRCDLVEAYLQCFVVNSPFKVTLIGAI